ncbi:MAG TPA: FHA domain-containing protein [Solirubrobacteraceae bacterium]
MSVTRAPFGPHWASAAELKEQLEAARQGEPFLVYRDDGGAQRIVILPPEKSCLTVGRAPGTDICLSWDDEVSRVHAEIERLGPDWTVADHGLSRNGTFVNGTRVAGRLRLHDGDVIDFGGTQVGFRAPRPALEATSDARQRPRPEISPAQRRVLIALCRPFQGGNTHAAPASNKQIADELVLSVEGVKTQIRSLFERFEVEDLPQNRKRARLVELAFSSGMITRADLES